MKLFALLFALIVFANFASAQNSPDNLLEKVELKFYLDGEPTPEDVGFVDPKSNWKLEYELLLIDSAELEKIGRCHRNEVRRFICPNVYNQNLDRKIKKISTRIVKGKFSNKPLMPDSNREVTIPVQLSPEVIAIFNRAETVVEENPTFVLFIKTNVSTKNAAKVKFKKKFSTNGIHPLKSYAYDKITFWNVRSFGVALGISKSENGKIIGFSISR